MHLGRGLYKFLKLAEGGRSLLPPLLDAVMSFLMSNTETEIPKMKVKAESRSETVSTAEAAQAVVKPHLHARARRRSLATRIIVGICLILILTFGISFVASGIFPEASFIYTSPR